MACGGTGLRRFAALAGAVIGLLAGIVGVGAVASAPPASAVTTSSATTITAGASHSCLIRGGAAYCWVADGSGQLGNGTTTAAQNTPVAVTTAGTPLAGPVPLSQIVAGTSFACALGSAGNAYCWGLNSSGQLGDPDTAVNSSVPASVLSETSQIAVGYDHSCLLRNGKAWCWGDDSYGELGNNTTTTTAQQSYLVNDATGSGAGWHVTASATTFTTGTAALPDSGTFVTTGSTTSVTSANAPSPVCSSGATCLLPSNTSTYPIAFTTAATSPTALTICDTAILTGLGSIIVGGGANPVGWWLNVPASAVAGTYTSTVTLQIIAGP